MDQHGNGRGGGARAHDHDFAAVLQISPNPGGWTYVVMPGSADFFGTRCPVKIRGTIDGQPLHLVHGAGAGTPKLPVPGSVPELVGDDVAGLW